MSTILVINAFKEAAGHLGFSFEPSFTLALEDGKVIETLGLVRHFGSKAGTVLFLESSAPSPEDQIGIRALGYYFSFLYPSYSQYEAALFKDTLNDWQYFGPLSRRPSWYLEKSWS